MPSNNSYYYKYTILFMQTYIHDGQNGWYFGSFNRFVHHVFWGTCIKPSRSTEYWFGSTTNAGCNRGRWVGLFLYKDPRTWRWVSSGDTQKGWCKLLSVFPVVFIPLTQSNQVLPFRVVSNTSLKASRREIGNPTSGGCWENRNLQLHVSCFSTF